MSHTYHLTRTSSNAKTGPIPVSTTSEETCPPSCPFYRSGCYAEGYHLRKHWDKVSDGSRGGSLEDFVAAIRSLPRGQLWRMNQAGDLPGRLETIDAAALEAITKANRGKRGFTYTHKPPTPSNIKAVRKANRDGFTISLSANGLRHAQSLRKHGLPLVTVLPHDAPTFQRLEDGTPVLTCPATRKENVTCATCGICAKSDRTFVVGFPSHGNQWRKAEGVLQ